jgi:chemotaxis response regulator CheB
MTRVVVVADRGEDFASLTAAVRQLPGACLVRAASGAARVDRMVGAVAPDLVVIGALRTGERSVARVAEVHRAAPAARVVVLSSAAETGAVAGALRAEAVGAGSAPVMPSPTKEGPACVR